MVAALPDELTAFLAVAGAELADKSMLASISLGAYFAEAPGVRWPLVRTVLGYFAAILLNHALTIALASRVGEALTGYGELATGVSLLVCAFLLWREWSSEEEDGRTQLQHKAPFRTTFLVVSMAELLDKTQVATAALAVGYPDARLLVTTVSAMMAIGVPAILFGRFVERHLRSPRLRSGALAVLVGVGLFVLVRALVG